MRAALTAGVLAILCVSSAPGFAQDVSITSRTVYHAYQIRLFADPSSEALRHLNRFYQTIDAGLYALGPSGQIDAVFSLRYDTDFGTGFHRDTPDPLGIPAADGRDDFDLMYFYVDWRDVIPERLDLRLGRQLMLDDLDWFSLDGIKLTGHISSGNFVELYFGRSVPYEAFLSSDPFLNDGVFVSDGEKIAFGGAAFFKFFEDLSLSAAYRQELILRGDDLEVFNSAVLAPEVVEWIRQASAGSMGLQESLFGASIGYTVRPIDVNVFGHLTWNLLAGELDQTRAGLAYNPDFPVHAQVEYLRVRPRFAGDSIFNVFNIFPYDRVRGELNVSILRGLTLFGGYFLQKVGGGPKGPKSLETVGSSDPFETGGTGATFDGSDMTHGPSLGLNFRRGIVNVGAIAEATTNTSGQYAYGGNYRRADLFGDVTLFDEHLIASLRLNYTGFQNDWFQARDAGLVEPEQVSYSIDVGAYVRFTDHISSRINFIKNFQSVLEGSYRVYSALEVAY